MLASNLLLVLVVALFAGMSDRARLDQRLLRSVESTHRELQTNVDLTIALLRGGLGLFEASVVVEPEEFRAYVEPLGIRERYPNLLGLGYALRLEPGEEGPALEKMRERGQPAISVWPHLLPSDNAVIVYLEPRDRGNQRALGFNMAVDPARRRAQAEARDSGEAAASTLVTLVQEAGGADKGFLIFLPHYAPGLPRGTVEERRGALRGFVFAPVRVRELVADTLMSHDELAVRIYAGPVTAEPVFEVSSALPWRAPVRRELHIAGQEWTLLYQFREPINAWWRSPAVPVALTGVVFAILFYLFQRLQLEARRRAESDAEALRKGEQRYRFLAEAMPLVVFTADAEGRITYLNRPGELAVDETVESRLRDRLHPDDRDEVLASWRQALRDAVDWQRVFRLDLGGQFRWHLCQAVVHRHGDSLPDWVGTLTDIDVQKQAEASLQRQAEELEARVAERTAELSRTNRELENFAAVASHDLQEPLRKIVAFGGRLTDALGPDIPPEAADALARMRASAKRLHQLIGDLLTFARISRAEVIRTPVDLERLAEAVMADLAEGHSGQVQIEVRPLPLACGDLGLLRQLLQNLLSNAIKFHRPGVPARVTLSAEDAGDEIPAARRDAYFRLLVEDQGIGFDAKYLDRIFLMFQRLHPRDRYEGTGIGLAICQRVVELHGGHITARNVAGPGACFVATLPRASDVQTPGGETTGC
ncbi:MAG: CHASE domain-containing protein [Myxococcota bacterium]